MINQFYDLDDSVEFQVYVDFDSGYGVDLNYCEIPFDIQVYETFDRYEAVRFPSGLMMHRGIGTPHYHYAIYRGLSHTYMESYSHGSYHTVENALGAACASLLDYVESSYFWSFIN